MYRRAGKCLRALEFAEGGLKKYNIIIKLKKNETVALGLLPGNFAAQGC